MKSSMNRSLRLACIVALPLVLGLASNAQAQGCKVVRTFVVGKEIPENEALKDMLNNTVGKESADLSREIQAEFKTAACVAIVVEEEAYEDAAVILMRQEVKDKMVSYTSTVTHARMDTKKLGCQDLAKLDVDSRIDKCSESGSTYYPGGTPFAEGDNYAPVTVVGKTKSVLESIFITGKASSLKNALAKFGLEDQAVRVASSLILMRGASTASTLVLKAQGYQPDLLSEGLWKKRLHGDPQTEKLVSALLFLNSKDQAFLDVNLGGPKIVDLNGFQRPQIGTLMGYDLYHSVMNAMAKAGYSYAPTWSGPN